MPTELSEPYSRDTTPEAQRVLNRMVLEMPQVKRAQRFFEVNRFAREQGIAGHMKRDPSLTRRQAYLKVIRENLGDDLYFKVYGRP